uniref:50S ribosomal protein L2P n=1 Tax=Anthurium amnicola TaxID=1678845 RepID=A0A1D1YMS8_9ARAE
MEPPGDGRFGMEGAEAQPRSTISRSNSSQPLLESAPCSHDVAVVYPHEAEVMMASRGRVVTVAGREKPLSPGVIADGCGEHVRSSVWGYVGRLFQNKNTTVAVEGKESDSSPQGVDGEHEREGKKTKKNKKRSSWLPDPEKRWPIQGFH